MWQNISNSVLFISHFSNNLFSASLNLSFICLVNQRKTENQRFSSFLMSLALGFTLLLFWGWGERVEVWVWGCVGGGGDSIDVRKILFYFLAIHKLSQISLKYLSNIFMISRFFLTVFLFSITQMFVYWWKVVYDIPAKSFKQRFRQLVLFMNAFCNAFFLTDPHYLQEIVSILKKNESPKVNADLFIYLFIYLFGVVVGDPNYHAYFGELKKSWVQHWNIFNTFLAFC